MFSRATILILYYQNHSRLATEGFWYFVLNNMITMNLILCKQGYRYPVVTRTMARLGGGCLRPGKIPSTSSPIKHHIAKVFKMLLTSCYYCVDSGLFVFTKRLWQQSPCCHGQGCGVRRESIWVIYWHGFRDSDCCIGLRRVPPNDAESYGVQLS